MKTISIFAFCACLGAMASCSNQSKPASEPAPEAKEEVSALGDWVKPIPGIGGEEGISIMADGKAASINRATLVYESWEQSGDTLFVSGKSIGNGSTCEMTDTLLVQGDSLAHTAGGKILFKYNKKK
mgnify:CR=1 FL=1